MKKKLGISERLDIALTKYGFDSKVSNMYFIMAHQGKIEETNKLFDEYNIQNFKIDVEFRDVNENYSIVDFKDDFMEKWAHQKYIRCVTWMSMLIYFHRTIEKKHYLTHEKKAYFSDKWTTRQTLSCWLNKCIETFVEYEKFEYCKELQVIKDKYNLNDKTMQTDIDLKTSKFKIEQEEKRIEFFKKRGWM